MQESVIHHSWVMFSDRTTVAVDHIAGFRPYGSGLGFGPHTEILLVGGLSVFVNETVEQVKHAVENS